MTSTRKLGIAISILAALMFIIGASVFTYRGNINPVVSKIGMFSFMLWLPTIIVGVILVAVGKKRNKKSDTSK
ncbi:hypothetical protein INQ51_18755 [Maribellus sp. CM-23]|uniref:hypothetical protein n=1 Tax=Maribellus sp. CM-23 TaxID=2781026 RepID=UPI001F340175|nr:hypothetical protein [Maribellus sp. CM-23]MCE4566368.1 hypothetical protein [Maribellus sp. CM-23]